MPIPVRLNGSVIPTHEVQTWTMQRTKGIEGTGYSLYTANLTLRHQTSHGSMFTTIMSYGLRGRGRNGAGDVEVPFSQWRYFESSCALPPEWET